VRQQPFSVVLFDEVEKAAPEVFDALLGLLDEGRLSDRFGRVTQFRSSIVVMTSNLGASATAAMGFAEPGAQDYSGAVVKFFRPEFFNRLDAVVAFRSLAPEQVRLIARKELKELAAREGFVAAGIRLEWSEQVIDAVARAGYDHQFGARPLQRAIERLVAVPLARWRVANPSARDRVLRIENGDDGLCVKEI
jgi:ATP-dependent Clp protease ATP-binding subunit ClpC